MSTPVFNRIIRELCDELGIHYTELSDSWVFRLERDGITHFISGNRFDLNPAAAGAIADDKVSTYAVLHDQDVPAVPHELIYNPGFIFGDITPDFPVSSPDLAPNSAKTTPDRDPNSTVAHDDHAKNPDFTEVVSSRDFYLNSLPYPVVIKPNHGSRGRDVYLCHDRAELDSRLDLLLMKDETICISPYFPAEFEYRCFFLDGEILLIYGKHREKGSFQHNLSHGASPVLLDPTSELYHTLESLATRAGTAIGIRFATIDILVGTTPEVLEINAGVTTTIFAEKLENGYDLAKNIYRQALKHLFSL